MFFCCRRFTYFDQLSQDEGYAGSVETSQADMAFSHQIKRFFLFVHPGGFVGNRKKHFLGLPFRAFIARLTFNLTRKSSQYPQPFAQITTLSDPFDAIYQHENVIFEIPLEFVFYPYQFGYAIDAWHPFVKTLLEYAVKPELTYEDSTLCDYYNRYQPKTVRDVLLFGELSEVGKELTAFPAQHFFPILPWDPAIVPLDRGERGLGASHGNQGFGPVSHAKGKLEFKRLVETFCSIQAHGYQPTPDSDGEITGYFVRHEGDCRFIVRSGLHRTAALSALGNALIRVRCFPSYPRYVDTALVKEWPLVKQGQITVETALAITERFFSDDGKNKAKLIGLLP